MRGDLVCFVNFAVNRIETNAIVNFAENSFDCARRSESANCSQRKIKNDKAGRPA